MAKELATGLALRQGTLEYTTLRKARTSHTVVDTASVKINREDGSPANLPPEAGSDMASLGPEIRKVLGKRESPVSITLSPSHVFMRVVELPTVDDDELAGMIQLQVDKFSPFATDAVVISHEVLSTSDSSSSVLITVAERDTVASIGDVMTSAGIVPQRVDIETLSWLRLLKDIGKLSDTGSQVVVFRDVSASEIVVLKDGLPVAFQSLGETANMTDEDLGSEIEYSLTTLEVEHEIGAIKELALWHWGAKPAELSALLEGRLSLKVRCEAFESLPSLSEGAARRFLDGTAGSVNLSLAEWHARESDIRLRRHLIAASAAAVLVWLLAILGLIGAIQYGKHRLVSLEAMQKEIEEPATRAREIRKRVRTLRHTEGQAGQSSSALQCLSKIAEAVPHTTSGQMQGIDEIRLLHYDAANRNRLELRGEASDPNYVYDFEKALNACEIFVHVELKGPRQIRPGKHSFTILLGLPSKEGNK